MQGSSSGVNGDAVTTAAAAAVAAAAKSGGHQHQFVTAGKRSATDAGLSMSSDDDGEDDDDDMDDDSTSLRADGSHPSMAAGGKKSSSAPANGKKTKGRVKIKMEFIDNKLRRYTTFSKRKTGIMKKAYELSTLTGTQVMLLVASETGHVYTFATRKLQPMITSEAGKALIQTCLNSPDSLLNCGPGSNDNGICGNGGGGGNNIIGGATGNDSQPDQRMSATGFEETEFTYSINDEDQKADDGKSEEEPYGDAGASQLDSESSQSSLTLTDLSASAIALPVSAIYNSVSKSSPLTVKTVQIPSTAASQPSGNQPTTATIASGANSFVMVPASQHGLSMIKGNVVSVASVGGVATTVAAAASTAVTTTPIASPMASAVMYQTPQGFLYATPTTATLPEGVLLNFGQLQQQSGANSTSQQYITIPLSLAPASQATTVRGVGQDGSNTVKTSVTDLSKSGTKK